MRHELVDTHCHIHEAPTAHNEANGTHKLWLRAETRDGDELVDRAAVQDVKTLICVGTTAEDSRLAVDFVQNRPGCFASIGLHPHEAKFLKESGPILNSLLASDESHDSEASGDQEGGYTSRTEPGTPGEYEWEGALRGRTRGAAVRTSHPSGSVVEAPPTASSLEYQLRVGGVPSSPPPEASASRGTARLSKRSSVARGKKIVAIGECGLDYFYNHSDKRDQKAALRFQIELALEHDLPVIFHVREAFDDFWSVFDSYKNIRGVLHSFTDSRGNLDKALERGLYIGVNGIMTFTKDQAQLEVAKAIPLKKLLLETDAPFLTPAPFRGRVNEPAHVRLVADFMAHLRDEPLAELANQTSANAQTLFLIK